MNKYLFLFELRKELSFMTPDDKDAAAKYYEEYFAEAGLENEQRIIDELGPPSRLAAELKREYEEGRPEPSGKELAVPGADCKENPGDDYRNVKPFADGVNLRSPLGNDPFTDETKDYYGADGRGDTRNGAKGNSGNYSSEAPYGSRPRNTPPYGSYKYGKPPYGSREYAAAAASGGYNAESQRQGTDAYKTAGDGTKPSVERSGLRVWAIILLVIFAVPIGAVLFGFAIAIFSVFIAFVAAGAAIVASGVAVFATGFWALGFLPDALMMFGAGLLIIAIGLPILWLSIWSCGKAARGISGAIRAIARGVTGKRRKKDE